jgi:AraC-like DNA-binding protein
MLNQDYLTVRLVRLKPSEEWSNERGRLSFIFPKGGHGRYVSGPVAHRLSPGDVLVVNAASEDKIGIPGTGELVFWCFSVCFENLFPLFASNEICLLQSITDGLKKAKLYPASTPLAAECHRLLADIPPHAELGHRGQLLRIVAALLSMEFKNARRQRVGFVRVEEHMSQVFENLPAAEILNLSVDELATKFGCSRRHLSRLFHQYFGMSIAALRMEMRLLKAVSLLRNRDAKITNVAEECGFNHLGLFNTCFQKALW